MAEERKDSEVKQPLPFLEVLCKSTGKIRRFSNGTEAGFAVNLINKKVLNGNGGENVLMASHIEAVKLVEEEEPISFGHTSLLVDSGPGWKLQTVLLDSHGDKGGVHAGTTRMRKDSAQGIVDSHSTGRKQSPISLLYIGKILFAFLLMFVIGAIFTLALENLPQIILYVNSSLQ